jgi:hypothetical protein
MVPRASEVAAASMIGARRFPHYATHRPDGGDLDKILACGRAVVTVNSTVSSLALECAKASRPGFV